MTSHDQKPSVADPIGLRHAVRGILVVIRSDRNFKIEMAMGLAALALAFTLGVSVVPVLLCVGLVLGLELVNSSLERIVDLASPDHHPLARDAKDVAAGAVLIASIASLLVGLVHMGPPLVQLLLGGTTS